MTDNPHIRRAYAAAAGRDPDQTVFLQALETLYESLAPLLEEQPHLSAAGLPERLGEPEVTAIFPVIWDDRRGRVRQARGHFIQYSTALGPWRGEILFRRGLDISAAKALALASTLEHSLAGLAVGGGLAGADADPRAMDDGECLRFCRAFMEGLYPLLPRDFHPGLWEGLLPRRELAYLTGQYQRLSAWAGRAEGAVFSDERPLSRQQAAGWGLCQFAELALRQQAGVHLEDQAVLVAGQDGAAGWAGERAARMGARVLAVGDGSGGPWRSSRSFPCCCGPSGRRGWSTAPAQGSGRPRRTRCFSLAAAPGWTAPGRGSFSPAAAPGYLRAFLARPPPPPPGPYPAAGPCSSPPSPPEPPAVS